MILSFTINNSAFATAMSGILSLVNVFDAKISSVTFTGYILDIIITYIRCLSVN